MSLTMKQSAPGTIFAMAGLLFAILRDRASFTCTAFLNVIYRPWPARKKLRILSLQMQSWESYMLCDPRCSSRMPLRPCAPQLAPTFRSPSHHSEHPAGGVRVYPALSPHNLFLGRLVSCYSKHQPHGSPPACLTPQPVNLALYATWRTLSIARDADPLHTALKHARRATETIHKLLCATFSDFASSNRPTENQYRAVLCDPDKGKPEFIWIYSLWIQGIHLHPKTDPFMGEHALVRHIPLDYNSRLERDLPNTLLVSYRDTFMIDRSRTNQSIGSITATQPGKYSLLAQVLEEEEGISDSRPLRHVGLSSGAAILWRFE